MISRARINDVRQDAGRNPTGIYAQCARPTRYKGAPRAQRQIRRSLGHGAQLLTVAVGLGLS